MSIMCFKYFMSKKGHRTAKCEFSWMQYFPFLHTSIIGYIIMHSMNCKLVEYGGYYSMSFCCCMPSQRMQSFFIMTERHLCFTFTSKLLEIMRCCYLPQGTLHRVFILNMHRSMSKKYIFHEKKTEILIVCAITS